TQRPPTPAGGPPTACAPAPTRPVTSPPSTTRWSSNRSRWSSNRSRLTCPSRVTSCSRVAWTHDGRRDRRRPLRTAERQAWFDQLRVGRADYGLALDRQFPHRV